MAKKGEDTADATTTIVIATGETPPLASENLHQFGYMNHIVSAAFAEVDIEVKFHFLPWSRSYEKSRLGKYPATSYWFADPKHEVYFHISQPLTIETVEYYRHHTVAADKTDSFEAIKSAGLKIGLTRGYTYTPELWRYARQCPHKVSIVNTDLQNLKMLSRGRIDVFQGESVIVEYLMDKHLSYSQRSNIKTATTPHLQRASHLMFSKQYPKVEQLRDQFNEGLLSIRRNGKLHQIKKAFEAGHYH